ncbi:retropepsin-like aspartic protease [Desulfoscipio gibsoniae]|uniref:Putative aspartyl protease n=1 Tax=Desulfoscipio gibsoniae DSM 7213 TaxID=767817 RepID=R4KDB1_9FIRM|nr:retropepsin-like aspartic protease [Desulfoscipio gibsoniae]AGL00559.1 putative aspartyl protease [Desulfoscipio gibsoniae DSM 7213]
MYRLQFKNGLLYADIVIAHHGEKITINDVIIDTGASHSIILPDFLHEHDIGFDDSDELVVMSGIGGVEVSAVRKKIDTISIGDITLEGMIVDFGVIDPKDRVNGLIGLDFLKSAKVIINVDELTLYTK